MTTSPKVETADEAVVVALYNIKKYGVMRFWQRMHETNNVQKANAALDFLEEQGHLKRKDGKLHVTPKAEEFLNANKNLTRHDMYGDTGNSAA